MFEHGKLPTATEEVISNSGRRFLWVYIGNLKIATLEWMEPIPPGSSPVWWLHLPGDKVEEAGPDEDKAVRFALIRLGYVKKG